VGWNPDKTRLSAVIPVGADASSEVSGDGGGMGVDSPDVVIAKRLLDQLKQRGFQFQRIAPGEDGPLIGNRVAGSCVDMIHIEGFSRDCFAWRQRSSSLILPRDALVERRADGSALDVLNEVLTWEPKS
jgi:hypothetical protein